MKKTLKELLKSTTKEQHLIHCITNPISITLCANALLSLGAKPIMAEHPKEVSEITARSDALLLNIGNITDARLQSIVLSAKKASRRGIPMVLDCVGISCSSFRRKFVLKLLKRYKFQIIKGNFSEISALYKNSCTSRGVDSTEVSDLKQMINLTKELSQKYDSVILASGKTDIITDKSTCALIKNGVLHLSEITGTGCLLGALCARFLPSSQPFYAAILSCALLGISGELSLSENKNGTFLSNLLDTLSGFDLSFFEKNLNAEVFDFEKT